MQHASSNYKRTALGWMLLAGAAAQISVAQSAGQVRSLSPIAVRPSANRVNAPQITLQQAMLRSAAPVSASASVDTEAAFPPSTDVASALQQIAMQAGVIFTGSVAAVQAEAGGTARVSFQVERGLRGVASGAAYALRVSAWAGGADCFNPGERALFLLTAPTVAGFSAPVMGQRGVIPLSGDGLVGNLDLRWVASDVQRGSPATTQETSSVRAFSVHAASAPFAATPESSADVTTAADSTISPKSLTLPDVHAIDRDLVLDLLRSAGSTAGQARS